MVLPHLILFLIAPLVAIAQEGGGLNGPTTSPEAAGYNCDASKCKLPNCNCASVNPPGGLNPKEVPQFVVFTADDAIQEYTIASVNQFLAQRKNPNGCPPKMTYYVSIDYTNFALVTDWYVAGNEIADHTMTHVGNPPVNEINGNLVALNKLAGVPQKDLIGFRAPFLNWTIDLLHRLVDAQFTYDSSLTSSIPVTDPRTDAYWPYTLDYGLANDCLAVEGACQGKPVLPGFWEIPMYAIYDERGGNGIHLMDPWLDSNGNDSATLSWMQNTFRDHYNGNRQPFGLYTHPIHVAPNIPNTPAKNSTIAMINRFIDWAQEQQDVWIVSSEQLLAWVRNPVPASRLNELEEFTCQTPQVSEKICNGIPSNEEGLLANCNFADFPFKTCYGCPEEHPSPANPDPPQKAEEGKPLRQRLPSNCSTPFWDPIGARCLCTGSQCAFIDSTRPVGPNGGNLTGGGTGGDSDPNAPKPSPTSPYTDFNAVIATLPSLPAFWVVALTTLVGAAMGAVGLFA